MDGRGCSVSVAKPLRDVQPSVPGLEESPYHPTLDFPITNDPLSDSVIRRQRLREKLFPDLLEMEHELQNSSIAGTFLTRWGLNRSIFELLFSIPL